MAVAPDGTVYFDVGSSSNASPGDRTCSPPRAVIMAVNPDGSDLRVVETGVRNGEGLAVAPDGSVWTAVNNRDNIPYPFHSAYAGHGDAFGQVIQAYVNEHPPDEVVPVTAGRDLGWPYCNPDQDREPSGRVAGRRAVRRRRGDQPGRHPAGLRGPAAGRGRPPGPQRPARHVVPGGQRGPGAVVGRGGGRRARLVGPPAAPRPRPCCGWRGTPRTHTLKPAVTLVGGFQNADGGRWGRPVDAVPGPDGALYVSDDTAGAIYRLAPPEITRHAGRPHLNNPAHDATRAASEPGPGRTGA